MDLSDLERIMKRMDGARPLRALIMNQATLNRLCAAYETEGRLGPSVPVEIVPFLDDGVVIKRFGLWDEAWGR